MLSVGDTAPEFELPDETNTPRRLTTLLADGPVVLFFYPAALTKGCTAESCHFRDLAAEFAKVGAQRIGISTDTVAKQKEFSDKHSFDYPLLSDADGTVSRAFGVKRSLDVLKVKRATFVIGKDQTIIDAITSELNMNTHADKALAALGA